MQKKSPFILSLLFVAILIGGFWIRDKEVKEVEVVGSTSQENDAETIELNDDQNANKTETFSQKTYSSINEIPITDSALVLGAAAYPNRLSAVLEDRVLTAIELYQARKVKKLIMSGGSNEAPAMKEYAVEKGVPAEVIEEDPNGINTFASIKNIVDKETNITLVTQAYHLPRALLIAEGLEIQAIGMEADKREYADIEEYKEREVLATGKAILDLMREQ